MSENVTFSVEVFSPRWGHGDTYIIVLSDRVRVSSLIDGKRSIFEHSI